MVSTNLATWHFQLTAGSWKFFHSEYCNTLVLRSRLILNDKIFSIGIGIVIEFSKLRYWYWYLYWFSKSGVLVLKSVSISEIWNIDIDIGIETWFFRIKYWYWLIRAGIAHLCPTGFIKKALKIRKVNSTACASNKNKTFHQQAFITTHRLSSGL